MAQHGAQVAQAAENLPDRRRDKCQATLALLGNDDNHMPARSAVRSNYSLPALEIVDRMEGMIVHPHLSLMRIQLIGIHRFQDLPAERGYGQLDPLSSGADAT